MTNFVSFQRPPMTVEWRMNCLRDSVVRERKAQIQKIVFHLTTIFNRTKYQKNKNSKNLLGRNNTQPK